MSLTTNAIIALISATATTLLTISHKYLTDQKQMQKNTQEIKKQQKILNTTILPKEEKEARQKKIISLGKKNMKQGLKASLITMLPIILLFALIPTGLKQDWWLTTYIITAIATSTATRKIMKIK